MFKNDKEKTILNKMKYFSDQRGILNRYINNKEAWNSHLEKTRNFILKSISGKYQNSIAILGSGWLLDIPIADLINSFSKVYLFDINHPIKLQLNLKKYKNVYFVKSDLTGGLVNAIYTYVKLYKKTKQITPIKNLVPLKFDLSGFDIVVSTNILNQLDLLLKEYLFRYYIYSNQELLELSKIVQSYHLSCLPYGKSCLITDYEEILIDSNNHVISSKPLIYIDLPQAKRKETWEWHFDINRSYNKNVNTIFNVIAIEF